MAMHPDKEIVATGTKSAFQKNKLVDIYVWSISTQEVLARLSGFHRGAVGCLRFSPDGSKLLSIGQNDQQAVAIYDWSNQVLLGTTNIGSDQVCDADWETNSTFMTAGNKMTQFFTLEGKNIRGEKGVMGNKRGRLQQHRCCAYAFKGTKCLTGNQTGDILEWQKQPNGGHVLANVHPAHTGAVW